MEKGEAQETRDQLAARLQHQIDGLIAYGGGAYAISIDGCLYDIEAVAGWLDGHALTEAEPLDDFMNAVPELTDGEALRAAHGAGIETQEAPWGEVSISADLYVGGLRDLDSDAPTDDVSLDYFCADLSKVIEERFPGSSASIRVSGSWSADSFQAKGGDLESWETPRLIEAVRALIGEVWCSDSWRRSLWPAIRQSPDTPGSSN